MARIKQTITKRRIRKPKRIPTLRVKEVKAIPSLTKSGRGKKTT